MSFYTSLTGLNAATAQLGVTSNNIANVSTTGFKRSRTDFGDVFATSPLQKASSTIGQGVSLKRVVQEFGQGNMVFSSNTLDLAISGDGFFPLKSQDGFQDIFTRNGVFMMNDQYNVVNSAGQRLMAASVDSSGKANLDDMNVLTIPQKTTGMAKQTSKVQLGLNFPADASVVSKDFNRNDPTTYNKSTALTVYDAGGNSYLASVYYVKTQNASQATPNNKWQTYVYVGDKLVNASLQQATNNLGDVMYVNKYGELKAKADFKTPTEIAELNSSFSKKTIKFSLDQLTDVRTSKPATVTGGSAINLGTGSNDGVDLTMFNPLSKSDLLVKQGSSGAVFDMNQSVAADSYKLTFNKSLANGPEAVTVNVATIGTSAPTVADVVKALNANSTFASAYVAQNTSTVTIAGPTFATTAPTSSDFTSFDINIGGKAISLTGLRPASSDLAGLAAELQDRLRSKDGGKANLSVVVAPNGKDLKITDSAGRVVTDAGLKLKTGVGNGASVGEPTITMGVLRVTSLDPNMPERDILADMTLSKTVGGLPDNIVGKGIATEFPRSTANYNLDSTATLYNAEFGPITDRITVSKTSVRAFADALNNNTTFAASYEATVSNGVLSVTAKNPADSAGSINTALNITQTVAGAAAKVDGVERTAARYALGNGPFTFSSGLIKASSDGTVRQNGTAANTETAVVTFPSSLSSGQSVTVAGLTFTASTATTADELAALFGGLTEGALTSVSEPTTGSFTGSLVGFDTAASTGATVTLTSTTVDENVSDVEVNGSSSTVKPSVAITQGTPEIAENTTVTFKALKAGESVTVGGLTYTTTNDASAEEVATVFGNLATGAQTSPTTGTFDNTLEGFTSGEAIGSTVTFTNTASGTNETDLVVTGISLNKDEFVDMLNASDLISSSFDVALVNGDLKVSLTNLASTGLNVASTVALTDNNTPVTASSTNISAGVPTDSQFVGLSSVDDLKNLFSINVDNSIDPVTVGLDRLIGSNLKLSGSQIAQELTNAINRAYGDEKPFNFASTTGPTFSIKLTLAGGLTSPDPLDIDLSKAGDSNFNMRPEDLVAAVQAAIDADPNYKQPTVVASYDTKLQKLVFTPKGNNKVTIDSKQAAVGLTAPLVQGVNDDSVGLALAPSIGTASYRSTNDQRYGVKVEYDAVNGGFVFMSGTTGDNSGISITNIRPNSLATKTSKGLGMTGDLATYTVAPSKVDALRGIASKPAVLTGNALGVNVDNNFAVDETNNQFVVSVNGVTGTVVIPPKDTYTMGTFMEALQSGINSLQSEAKDGLTPQTVDGVKVTYDAKKNGLVFTTGTASTSSYIKVTGDARWGLDGLDAQFGTTTTWIKPTPFKDDKGTTVYIDGFGQESSTASGFDTLPAWSPVYFDKGELTFDTAGNLVSPKQGAQLDTVYLPNGKGALTINIDYSKSTQFASPFSVLSQSQDGAPEGDLVGLAIKDDGLVSASFSNGSQKSLGKVVLVNFSNPTGLRQIGDTNYYKTSDSGTPKYGEAGAAGFGTVRSGATERANVDLTQELVDLITEQRNFQANAKAMETSTSMTQTIIQIRN